MLKIKLLDARMAEMETALTREADRLQNTADQVARIAAGLDMDLKASAGIEELLKKLRVNLKNQSSNLAAMRQLAQQASAGLRQKDDELAGQAGGLDYTMRQFSQRVQNAAALGGAASLAGEATERAPSLGMSFWEKMDATENLSGLFAGAGSGLAGALQGVQLGDLAQGAGGGLSFFGNDRVQAALGAAGAGTVAMAGIMGLAALLDKNRLGTTSTTLTDLEKTFVFNVDPRTAQMNEKIDWAQSRVDQMLGIVRTSGEKSTVDPADLLKDSLSGALSGAGDGLNWMSEKAVDGATWAGEKAADAGLAIWNGAKEIAGSKPVEYIVDMGGSVIGGGADILSLCLNVVQGNWAGVASDGYSFINNFFDFSQDGCALFAYGVGTGAEALGMDPDKAQFFYDYAEDYSNRNGLAGELRAEGAEGAATFVDVLDYGATLIDTATLLDGMWTGETFKNIKSGKDALLTGFGWKQLEEVTDYNSQLKYYSDLFSNVKTGYKYLDGFGEDGLLGLAKASWDNSLPGKSANGSKKVIGEGVDALDWLADQN